MSTDKKTTIIETIKYLKNVRNYSIFNKEFELLRIFLSHPGMVYSHMFGTDYLWFIQSVHRSGCHISVEQRRNKPCPSV